MTEQVTETSQSQPQAWRRFFEVRGGWREDETERLTVLYNILMVLSAILGVLIAVIILIAGFRRLFDSIGEAFIAAGFPLVMSLAAFVTLYFSRRGHVRIVSKWFIWVTFTFVVLATLVFNGYQSPAWIVLLWPVSLAGVLLAPINAISMLGISLATYSAIYFVQQSLGYVPPLVVRLEAYRFLVHNFIMIFILYVAGFLTYLVGTNTHLAIEDRAAREKKLREEQIELTRRVDERTLSLANRATQLQVIAEVTRASSLAQDPDTVFQSVVGMIASRMEYYHVGVFVNDAANEWTELKAASSDGGQSMLNRGHRLRVGQQGIVGYTSGTGLPRYASSVGEDAVWFNNPDLPDTRSEIALPLTMDGRLFGVLDIQVIEISAFDQEDVQVLQILADGIAASYRNAVLLSESRQAIERYEQLQQENAIRAWRQALTRQNLSMGYAYDAGSVQPVDHSGDESPSLALPAGVTTDVGEDGQHRLMAPITVSGQNVGVLTFQRATPWTEETIRLADSVIAQLDLALTNARLLEETRLRASQEAARGEIVSRVRAMTSTDAILRNAAEELGRALDVERSRIQLVRYDQ